jgi:hypothetical protein
MQPDNKNPLAKSRPIDRHNQAPPDDFPSGLFTFIAFILVSYYWIEHTPVPSGSCGNVRFLCSVDQIYKAKNIITGSHFRQGRLFVLDSLPFTSGCEWVNSLL